MKECLEEVAVIAGVGAMIATGGAARHRDDGVGGVVTSSTTRQTHRCISQDFQEEQEKAILDELLKSMAEFYQ